MKTITLEVDDDDLRAITTALIAVHERNELQAGQALPESRELCGTYLAEVCRDWAEWLGLTPAARCIGCGCDDQHACPGGCSWRAVDRATGLGVCSQCPPFLVEQLAGEQRVRALHETIAEVCR